MPVDPSAIAEQLDVIDNAVLRIHDLIAAVEEPPPPPPPPPQEFSVVVPAAALRIVGKVAVIFDVDHIGLWGHPGEAVEFTIRAAQPCDIEVALDYVLARESQTIPSSRAISVNGSRSLLFPPTGEKWADKQRAWSTRSRFTVPAGDSVVRVENDTTVPWSNWLDLFAVGVTSTAPVELAADTVPPVPTYPPGAPVPPTPPAGATVLHVPRDGSFQSVLERARTNDFVYVDEPTSSANHGFYGVNRDNGNGDITVIGLPGHVLRCGGSGFEGFGSMRGWKLWNLLFEIDEREHNSGVSFYGHRTDSGADGRGCSRIGLYNLVVKPMQGKRIMRDGITLWGGDVLECAYCEVYDASVNLYQGGFGGAGSAISIGLTIGSPAPALANGARVWAHHNKVRRMKGDGPASADRNGINLDNYMLRPDHLVGLTLIEDNDIAECEGRGILAAHASDVTMNRNRIRPYMATNLGGSFPGGIVAAGFGNHGNIECNDNDVEVSPGFAAYLFDGVGQVRGKGNRGGPVVGSVVAGFTL